MDAVSAISQFDKPIAGAGLHAGNLTQPMARAKPKVCSRGMGYLGLRFAPAQAITLRAYGPIPV